MPSHNQPIIAEPDDYAAMLALCVLGCTINTIASIQQQATNNGTSLVTAAAIRLATPPLPELPETAMPAMPARPPHLRHDPRGN